MVRPEENVPDVPRYLGSLPRSFSCCIELAGASPAWVIAGEPSSRPQVVGRDPSARAGRQKPPSGREQSRGPQCDVNAAASSNYQPKGVRESRVAHVTTKATDIAQAPERAVALPGVWAAARGDSSMRNRRGPTRRPLSGRADGISAEREIQRCREGVRGGHSTGESRESGWREGPLGWNTLCVQVSARAWP